jgi:hypothetical protein
LKLGKDDEILAGSGHFHEMAIIQLLFPKNFATTFVKVADTSGSGGVGRGPIN